MTKQIEFNNAIYYNDINKIKYLLKNKEVNPSLGKNYAFLHCVKNQYIEIIEMLLNDKRVNPADNDNEAVSFSYNNNNNEVLILLLSNSRIQNTLKFDNPNLHSKIMKEKIQNKIGDF